MDEVNLYHPDSYWRLPAIGYLTITQTGDSIRDGAKIQLAHILVRELERRKDTTYGVELRFTAKANYRNFVEALNVCVEEDAPIFAISDSSILVYWTN